MKRKGPEESMLLEVVLQLHGDLRKILEPLRVTPLQAGALLCLSRHEGASLTDAAVTLHVSPPTLSEVVKDLVRKRWVTKRRSVTDPRLVHLQLSRRGHARARHIEQRIRLVEATLIGPDPAILCMHLKGCA